MNLQRSLVQFMHPGSEHGSDQDGVKNWNAETHRRKFILSQASYVDGLSKPAREGPVVFWGEWEPESEVWPVSEPRETDAPQWLHKPYYLRPASYQREGKPLQNTDPFVFGDRFLYTICRQFIPTRGGLRPTFLRDLARGSVILFGSHRRGEFVLDTVFVVADSVLHSATDSCALAERVGDTYADVTLRSLHDAVDPRLYLGATVEAPVDGMFSFVPCLSAEECAHGFPRPSIRLQGLITPSQTMGMKGKQERSLQAVREAWDSVVSQVTSRNLRLGVRLALPPMRGIAAENDPEESHGAGACPRIRC